MYFIKSSWCFSDEGNKIFYIGLWYRIKSYGISLFIILLLTAEWGFVSPDRKPKMAIFLKSPNGWPWRQCTKCSVKLSLFNSSIDHQNVHRRGNFGSNFTGPEVTSKLWGEQGHWVRERRKREGEWWSHKEGRSSALMMVSNDFSFFGCFLINV